ncbi:PUA domain-containing protein [Methanocaldococcus indicus]|uniref:PUA domain-containing protein n=1 Tax=Methanocaldococcus indicus TaxID=213231 RepID=UPI003C6D5280
MKVRELKDFEKNKIKEELLRYTNKKYVKNFEYGNLVAQENKWITVLYTNKETKEKLKLFDDIYSVGNVFGEIKRKKFKLSLEGFTLISKYIIKNYAIINDKGEQLFLYGRDIFKSSIIEVRGFGRIAVFNKNKEFLGIGEYNGTLIKNIKDKGWYLREGG